MILDADVLRLDKAFPGDRRQPVNRQFLAVVKATDPPRGVTAQILLEVVGAWSFNTPVADIPQLPAEVVKEYGLKVVPDPAAVPEYAACTVAEVVAQMGTQMALGDAVTAVQIAKYAPPGSIFVTWNARHFRGKVSVSVMTPEEWLQQNPPAPPPVAGPTP